MAKLALARLAITIRSPVLGMLPPDDLVVVVVVVVVVTVLESFCSWTWSSVLPLPLSSPCCFPSPVLSLFSSFSSELGPLSDSAFSEALSFESPFAASVFSVET